MRRQLRRFAVPAAAALAAACIATIGSAGASRPSAASNDRLRDNATLLIVARDPATKPVS